MSKLNNLLKSIYMKRREGTRDGRREGGREREKVNLEFEDPRLNDLPRITQPLCLCCVLVC